MENAAEEINTKLTPELQELVDQEQTKVNNTNHDGSKKYDADLEEFRSKNKRLAAGLETGNVIITWEADQKCIKPKITVNEKATKDEILNAVANAEYAYVACTESLEVLGQVCAPIDNNKIPKKKRKE